MKKIPELKLSKRGNELLDMYKQMVKEGYRKWSKKVIAMITLIPKNIKNF